MLKAYALLVCAILATAAQFQRVHRAVHKQPLRATRKSWRIYRRQPPPVPRLDKIRLVGSVAEETTYGQRW